MANRLLQLPAELRLQIYEAAVTSDLMHVISDLPNNITANIEYNTALALQAFDPALAKHLLTHFWSTQRFRCTHYVQAPGFQQGWQFCRWLKLVVGEDNAQLIRRLDILANRRWCEQRELVAQMALIDDPDDPYEMYNHTCSTLISIDLRQRNVNECIEVSSDPSCTHDHDIISRFTEILAPHFSTTQPPVVTAELLWDLFEGCHVLSPYRPPPQYLPFAQAVEMHVNRVFAYETEEEEEDEQPAQNTRTTSSSAMRRVASKTKSSLMRTWARITSAF